MIRSFKGKFAAAIAEAEKGDKAPKGFPAEVMNSAIRKLSIIDAAETIDDLRVPPGNRLEALKGDREGQHSIRINDQWRICFVWDGEGGADDVEIVDYH